MYSLTKKQQQSNSVARKNWNLVIKNKLTLWTPRAAGSGTGSCTGRGLLPCTHVCRAGKKTLIWINLNELSEKFSSDSGFHLVFEIYPFKVGGGGGCFLLAIFQSIPSMNGLIIINQNLSINQKRWLCRE